MGTVRVCLASHLLLTRYVFEPSRRRKGSGRRCSVWGVREAKATFKMSDSEVRMDVMHKTARILPLIHENFATVLMYSFAQPVATKWFDSRFYGSWEPLRHSLFDMQERRADRALLELAIQLRALDDEESMADYLKRISAHPLGSVTQGDGSSTDLHFRDMTNKIMHASGFAWISADLDNPKVVCQ